MRLRKECEHGRYDPHRQYDGSFHPEGDCPGGEFLADDALVIEHVDGEWQLPPRAWHVLNAAAALGDPRGSIGLLWALNDALTVRDGAEVTPEARAELDAYYNRPMGEGAE